MTSDTSQTTRDTFLNGCLTVYQHQSGYRFSIDAILLASYVRVKAGDRLVDLGCGCGIVALVLAYRQLTVQCFGIEIQPALAGLARKNVVANHMDDRIQIIEGDIKSISQNRIKGPVDIIVCNPPFGRIASGRISPDSERALARHEITMCLKDITATARRILRRGGKLCVIFPAERTADLFGHLRADGIEPKRIRPIQSHPTKTADRILVEGTAGGRPGMTIEPSLVIYKADGEYTDEVQKMMG